MISLLFSRGGDLSSLAIEWFGGTPAFSHVDAITPEGMLLGARSDSVGGRPAGVQVRPPDYLGKEVTLRVDLPATLQQELQFHSFLMTQIGKPYDVEGILGFIVGRKWDDPSAWFCSELVAAALEKCNYFLHKLAVPTNKITPGGLVFLLSAFVDI